MDEEVGNSILTPDRDSGDTGVSGIFVVVVSKLQPRSQQVGQRRRNNSRQEGQSSTE
jgi:hypothetical protein